MFFPSYLVSWNFERIHFNMVWQSFLRCRLFCARLVAWRIDVRCWNEILTKPSDYLTMRTESLSILYFNAYSKEEKKILVWKHLRCSAPLQGPGFQDNCLPLQSYVIATCLQHCFWCFIASEKKTKKPGNGSCPVLMFLRRNSDNKIQGEKKKASWITAEDKRRGNSEAFIYCRLSLTSKLIKPHSENIMDQKRTADSLTS